MGWSSKCPVGGPEGFKDTDAKKAVKNADFKKSVYVNTSEKGGMTRQAYTYYEVDGWQICVVGHIHVTSDGPAAGNSFIPGYDHWDYKTPKKQVERIDALKDGGRFPGNDRYPKKLDS